jgi:hypothetical protein
MIIDTDVYATVVAFRKSLNKLSDIVIVFLAFQR